MVGWIILGVIVFLIVVLMLIPVGADIGYEGGELRVSAKVDGMSMQLIPKKPVDETKPKKEKKPKKPKKEKPPEEQTDKPKKKLSLNFNRDELFGLVKAALKGFGKFGRKLKVDRFLLHYVAAGEDPYNTAMTYGYVNASLSALAPLCANRFTVRDCSVRTDVDFTAEKMSLDIGIAMTIKIGQIFGVVNTILFGALGILIKNKTRLLLEKLRAKSDKSEQTAQNDETVIDINEIKKENIQAEERMDSNG